MDHLSITRRQSQQAGGSELRCLEATNEFQCQNYTKPWWLTRWMKHGADDSPHSCLQVMELKGRAGKRHYDNSGLNEPRTKSPFGWYYASSICRPFYDTKVYVFTQLLVCLQINHIIALFLCNLPASGWEIGSVCFQCVQEEAELDSGTSCVPVGGSPVQSHTQTLWGQPLGARAGVQRRWNLSPLQIHTPTHSSPLAFLLLPFVRLSFFKTAGGRWLQTVQLNLL